MKEITQSEYAARRLKLAEGMKANSIAIIDSNTEKQRNNDNFYRFRQSSDLYYLTGFNEQESALVIKKKYSKVQSILFCRTKNKEKEIWDGVRLGVEGAIQILGVDEAYAIESFDQKICEYLEGCESIYCSFDTKDGSTCYEVFDWIKMVKLKVRKGIEAPKTILDLDILLHELRLIKSQTEIDVLQKAADITAKGFHKVLKETKANENECVISARLQFEYIKHGAHSYAYNPIVAGGKNACILHYCENNKQIKENQLVLIDSGAEYENYACDVTRTFPVSGTFTPEQKAIYQIVLKAQEAVINLVKPGVYWNELHETTIRIISEGLIELGLIKATIKDCIEQKLYLDFFMHNTGHWLGLDVHDVATYKVNGKWRELKEGMVFTVEPGIYISSDNQEVDSKWRGIGIRIEDDIVVTNTGHVVLTAEIPKTIEDLENR